jgi:hypothetical protein
MSSLKPYRIVISNSSGPQSQHAPKWDEDTEEVGDEEHGFGLELEVTLDIPKSERRCDRACRLRDAKVGNLQERK